MVITTMIKLKIVCILLFTNAIFGLQLEEIEFTNGDIQLKNGEITEIIDKSIKERIEYGRYVSIFIAIVDSSGFRYHSYGTISPNSKKKPDENSVYDIGSITKIFTTTILSEMVQKKELNLNDPISIFFPTNTNIPTRKGQCITLAHLATHTSGLPYLPTNFSPKDKNNPWSDYSLNNLMEFISTYELKYDIGERYKYSNSGFALLGAILTLKKRKSYDDLLQNYIAEPLGLNDTKTLLSASMKKRLITGHKNNKEVPIWTRQIYGHGGIKSTPKDLIRFIAANIGLIQTSLYSAMKFSHNPIQIEGSEDYAKSLGWEIRSTNNATVIYHDGSTSGYKSFAGFLKDSNRGVVVLTNSKGSIVDLGLHILHPSFELKSIEELTKKSKNN